SWWRPKEQAWRTARRRGMMASERAGRRMVSVPRLFIAVPVAPAVRAAIAALPREGTVSFRWVAPEQYHITLKFLGDVDEADVETVHEGVEEAAAAGPVRAFSLAAQGIGAFPNSRQPR